MQNRNGHKPAGRWRVWTFTAYEPEGPTTWWAYQNGAAPICARTKERLVTKVLAEELSPVLRDASKRWEASKSFFPRRAITG